MSNIPQRAFGPRVPHRRPDPVVSSDTFRIGQINEGMCMTAARTLALAMTMALPSGLAAQGLEITPFGGYQAGARLRVQEGDLRISDNPNLGVIINVPLQPGGQLELLFAHQETNMKLTRRATGLQETLFDMAVEYIQAGALYEADRNGRLKTFGTGTVGVTRYNPKERGRASEWRLSAGFGVGGKSFLSERVALRTEARLMFTLINAAGSFFCSSGSGCLTNVQGAGVVQVLLTAGLTFKFGR